VLVESKVERREEEGKKDRYHALQGTEQPC
jgi:hypothetical protein